MLNKMRRNAAVRKLTDFFYSPYYIATIGLVVIICYTLGWDTLCYGILAVGVSAALLFCDDATPVIPALSVFPFIKSMRWRLEAESFRNAANIVPMVLFGVLAGGAFVFHFIVHGGYKRFFTWGRMGIAMLALALGMTVSGFFSGSYSFVFRGETVQLAYSFSYMLNALQIALPLCGLYFVLRPVIRWNSITYLACAFMTAGIILSVQVAECYLLYKPFIESNFTAKDLMVAGWGISNNIGAAIFHCIPLTLYLACKEKKHAWFFVLAATVMFVCMAFTFCRSSLLFGTPLFLAGLAIACVKGNCRKQIWACVVVIAAMGVAVLCWSKTKELFGFYFGHGMDDSGRFPIYRLGFELFGKFPVFGVGLWDYKFYDISHYFHNTPIQFMAAGGFVGLGTYAFYRVAVVRLYGRKLSFDRVFLGLSVAAIVLISLLDNGFMRMYSHPFTVLLLLFSERDLERSVWFADCPKLGKRKALFAA